MIAWPPIATTGFALMESTVSLVNATVAGRASFVTVCLLYNLFIYTLYYKFIEYMFGVKKIMFSSYVP